jgi:hypothetical protein
MRMNVFDLRGRLIEDYRLYVESFIQIEDGRIRALVEEEIENGLLRPAPQVQLNPSFEPGGGIADLVGDDGWQRKSFPGRDRRHE